MDLSKVKVLSIGGPAGSGKDTVAAELVNTGRYVLAVKITTRKSRNAEKDVIFVERDRFLQMKENNEFAVTSEYNGELYAISYEMLEQCAARDVDIVCTSGSLALPARDATNGVGVFLNATNETLRNRMIKGRGDTNLADVENRLKIADEQRKTIPEYDLVVDTDNKLPQQIALEIDEYFQKKKTDIEVAGI